MNTVPEWSAIRDNVTSLSSEEQQQAFNAWEQDYASQLADDKELSKDAWEVFRVGSALARADLSGQGHDSNVVIKDATQAIENSYRNLPYFQQSPLAIYNDEEFERVIPTITNPLERAEARATRQLARQQKEDGWLNELGQSVGDLLDQASKDAKGPTVDGGRVGEGRWEDIKLTQYGGRDVFQILQPSNKAATTSGSFHTANGAWARDIGDITERIRAEGGDPQKLIGQLKQLRVWGNLDDKGNLARKLEDGRVIFNPSAGADLFNKEKVAAALGGLGLSDEAKKAAEEEAARQREVVAGTILNNLDYGSARWQESINPIGLMANAAELIGLKSDFNSFRAENDEKYDSDEALVSAYFDKVRSKPAIFRALDAYASGAYSGAQQFILGAYQVPAAVATIGSGVSGVGLEQTSKALQDIQKLQEQSQGSLAATGGETVATVARTAMDLAAMIVSGGVSSAATRTSGTIANRIAAKVARRMAANASERVTLGAAFNAAVANNVDQLATKVGRIVGEGTAAVQAASNTFGESYSANLADNMRELDKLGITDPIQRQEAMEAARQDAVWSATKDGVASGVITSAVMRLVPGGVESVLGKRLAETPGQVTLGSLLKDARASTVRTAFRNPVFRSEVARAAGSLGLEAGKEAVEEAIDETAQSLWAAKTYNPNMTVSDFFKGIGTAALLGGLFGTAVSGGVALASDGQSVLSPPAQVATSGSPDPLTPRGPVTVTPTTELESTPTEEPAVVSEQEAVDLNIQSDVDQIVAEVEAATAAVPEIDGASTPAVLPELSQPLVSENPAITAAIEAPQVESTASAISDVANEVSATLPQTAEVLNRLAEQTANEVSVGKVGGDFIEAHASPNPGDTVVYGFESEDTGLPEYRNVTFQGFDDRGRALIREGSNQTAVDPRDILFNDQPIIAPTQQPDVSTNTTTVAEVPVVDLPNNAETQGNTGSVEAGVDTPPSGADVVGVSEDRETAAEVPVREGGSASVVPTNTAATSVPSRLEPVWEAARQRGFIPAPAQLQALGFTGTNERKQAAVELAMLIEETYPINNPEDSPKNKGKSFWGSVKRTVSYPVASDGSGVFTNDPEMTVAQIINGHRVSIPSDGVTSLNPAIQVDASGNVTGVQHISDYVGMVVPGDTVRTVETRYKSDPSVKGRAQAQLESSMSQEREEMRNARMAAAVEGINSSPDKVFRVTNVQLDQYKYVSRLEEFGFSTAEADDIWRRAFDAYVLRINRSVNPSKISFSLILESSKKNYLKRQASVEHAFDTGTRMTSLDALTDQSNREDLDGEPTDDPELDTDIGIESEVSIDLYPTREEKDVVFDLIRQAQERDGQPGIIPADATLDDPEHSLNLLEDVLETLTVIDEEPDTTFTVAEQGLADYMLGMKATDPERYTNTLSTFRSYIEKIQNATTLNSRSIGNSGEVAPLMSIINEMKELGVNSSDPDYVKKVLTNLSKNKSIPKFYRDSSAMVLKKLEGRFPTIEFVARDAAFAGEFDPTRNSIKINTARDNGQGFIGAFLHETVHAAVARSITNPETESDVNLVNQLRELKDDLSSRLPGLEADVLAYKEQMLKDLKLDPKGNGPLINQIMNEAEADVMYSLGFDVEETYPLSGEYAYVERVDDPNDPNSDLQELAAHYFTDPMFRAVASKISTSQGNMGSRLQGILGSMVAGAKTAVDSARGKTLAAAAGWLLRDPRALPNSNNLFARPVETIRSYVQSWNVPNVNTETELDVENPPTFGEIDVEYSRRDPTVFHSRATTKGYGELAINPFYKADTSLLGGFTPSGLWGFGVTPKAIAKIQQDKKNTEAAAQTAAEFFGNALKDFLKRHGGKTPDGQQALSRKVNAALGSTENRLTDEQWKSSQQLYDDVKAEARSQYEQDMRHVQRLNRGGRPNDARVAYGDAIRTVRTTLEAAYKKTVAQREVYHLDNRAKVQAAQSAALNEIHQLDPNFATRLSNFRKRLDDLSSKVANSTGINPELKAAIDNNRGVYLHRAYRLFESDQYLERLMTAFNTLGDPPSPGTVDPLKDKVRNAVIEIRKELINETSLRYRRDSRDQMIRNHAQQNNMTVEQARAVLSNAPTPLSRGVADTQAADFIDNTEDGRAMVTRRFGSYAEALETRNPDDSTTRLVSRDTSIKADIVKRRKDLPKWLRELWGEYEDPFVNAANTLMELTAYTAQQKYLEQVVAAGLSTANGDIPFLTTAVPGTDGAQLARIPGVNTAGWVRITDDERSPLAGYYAHPFTKEVLAGLHDYQASTNKMVRAFHKMTGAAMAAKTTWSIQSHARNFFGNVFFIAANGNLLAGGPSKYADAWKESFGLLGRGVTDEQRQAEVEKLQRLGVLKDNQIVEILNQVSGRVDKIDFDQYDDEGGVTSVINDALGTALDGWRATSGFVKDAYQAGDDFWKVVSFQSERAKIDKWGSAMTDEQKDQEAARRVRMTMPTYSMAPEIVKIIRRTGVIGAFITFAAESVRVSANIVRLGVQDMKNSPRGSERWKQGAHRLAAVGFWQGVMGASFGPLMTVLFQSMAHLAFGDDEDDEIVLSTNPFVAELQRTLMKARNPLSEDEVRAFREFLPEWQKDAQMWFIGKDPDGNVNYVDVSYINPLSYFPEVFLSGYRGWNQPDKDFEDRLGASAKNALIQSAKPFLSNQLFATAVGDILFDKVIKPSAPAWAEGDAERIIPMLVGGRRDPSAGQILSGVNHLWANAFMPGTIRTAQRIASGATDQTDPSGRAYNTFFEVASASGLAKIESRSPSQMVANSIRSELSALTDASGNLTRTGSNKGSVSDEMLRAAVRTSEDNQFNAYKRMREIYKRGLALGLSPDDILSAAEAERVGKNVLNTIESGTFIPTPPPRNTLRTFDRNVPVNEKQSRSGIVLDAYDKEQVRSLDTD